MSLSKYKQKRSFTKTPEPVGGTPAETALHFVVQQHAATNLHYDFRLELKGVLKSWAVPKGPSTDPAIKRLAIMVEDHPYDYRTFEGIIPKGQYGGGTVIVWDEGTYLPMESEGGDKKTWEKELERQLKNGKLVFRLEGKKLKGEYALVKTRGRGENEWLLIKARDKYASTLDITKKNKSVHSGKTIPQLTAAATDKTDSKPVTKKVSGKRTAEMKLKQPDGEVREETAAGIDELLSKARKSAFPANLTPMLATLADEPFDDKGWLYEIKWDGYRSLAYVRKGKVELRSRNNKSFTEKFYPLADALKQLNMDVVLDGEIIVADDKGMANFGELQNWRSEADGRLLLYVFDILWLNGKSLLNLPLSARGAILRRYLTENDTILLSQQFNTSGTSFYASAEKMGLEGIIAKKAGSPYLPGERTANWLKIKTESRQEVVIGGFTKNDGSGKKFSSLLVGVYENSQLMYTGKVGTGFSDALQADLMKAFSKRIIKTPPFDTMPDVNKPSRFKNSSVKSVATWLKPELVCEVSFREMTKDGVMRHPSFKGLREDKQAKQVVLEKAVSSAGVVHQKATGKDQASPIALNGKSADTANGAKNKERKTLLNPSEETQVKKIQGHELKFTNLGKLYWPKEGITKRDMLNYYYQVAPVMLPYLKDRPHSLNRFPNGITGKSFYQKDVTGKVPDWMPTFPYTTDDVPKNFLVCKDEASLLYMASLGCIEMNPWSSRITKPDHPDWCIIDLDPGKKNTFNDVIEAALVTRQILQQASVEGYCKTSGSTGLHIYIPLKAKYDYEASREFGRIIAHLVQQELPALTSVERSVVKRRGKLYIDFLQNRQQATLAAAYSLRPKPFATVSMPLRWEEVTIGLTMKDFTIKNALARIRETGDIFSPVLGPGIDMQKAITNLNRSFKLKET